MKRLWKPKPDEATFDWEKPSPKLTAKLRMATLPSGPGCSAVFPCEELWVPIAIVNENVHILPGIPGLFQDMLRGYEKNLLVRIEASRRNIYRIMVSTSQPESQMAGYLTELQDKVKAKDVKVGSYPRWGSKKNTVTLVGRDKEYLESLVDGLIENIRGVRINAEGEDDTQVDEQKVGC